LSLAAQRPSGCRSVVYPGTREASCRENLGLSAPPAATGTRIRNFKLDHAQEKTVNAAIEKAKATSGTSVESAALELICLDYVGGQTLQERLAVLDPEALAKTFSDVLKAISKDAATAVIKSLYQNVTLRRRLEVGEPSRFAA
jgi:hypothetical protein